MKKYYSPDLMPLIVLAAGIVGMLLRLWQHMGGTDGKGLLIPGHASTVLLLILTVATLALILLCTWNLSQGSKYRYNFPESMPGCVGAGAAAAGVLVASVMDLLTGQDMLTLINGFLGMMAAASLCVLAVSRLRGQQPHIVFPLCVTLYLMLHLISQYRVWSGEPQLLSYCWPLLASVCVMLSAYQSAAFGGELGHRRAQAFFHLAALYFCCLSLIGDHAPGFYLAMGVWMFTDICRLTPMPRQFPRGEEA